ncbi:MAG TPA: 4-hydroxythreonine-4-phosphate dehydrogenase PdxA [Devosiaceae bacterium]|jgi:4-hydroxythreonine-4-phosphate dehydrogenase|nr:4-hydroxythreonine-4-phosphate dehydrogenase PdxA [Devosiaceae bacterium]
MSENALPPLAVTMGEPAGIGPDLILRLFCERAALGLAPFIVFGNSRFLAARAARLKLALEVAPTSSPLASSIFNDALPVFDIEGLVPDRPGECSQISAKAVIASITAAVEETLRGACRGIVTGPIHKACLYNAGFRHPGHTEFLAALCAGKGKAPRPVMMLAHQNLRVVPATIHVPLSAVPRMITPDLLLSTGRIVMHDLRTRFGIAEPRIAVTGLNPHAGEGGTIGMEDLDVIGPAVAQLAHEGFAIEGPVPADTLFHLPHWQRFDAVIAMYHDQALIPIKTVAFDEAVNVTLGLPIVRTSPDHGTAFDKAGTGEGSTRSLLAALRMADELTDRAKHRQAAE